MKRLLLILWYLVSVSTLVAQTELPPRRIEVAGTVTDSDGQRVVGALVTESLRRFGEPAENARQTTTNAEGKYVVALSEVPVGMHLKVYAPGYAFQSQAVSVAGEGEERTVDFELARSATIRVRLLDEADQPIAGAVLTAIDRNPPTPFWLVAEDWATFGLPTPRSDTQGWMEIPHQHPSLPINLTIEHPDYVPCRVERCAPQESPHSATMQSGARAEFRVTCASDPDAVSDAKISVHSSDESGHYRQIISVDGNGEAFARMADRHTTIRISHPTLYGYPWYFYRPNKSLMTFSLHETGKVRGQVIDETSGVGVANVGVHFAREHRVIGSARTDDQGRYEAELPDLDFEVSVTDHSAWVPGDNKLTVEIEPGQTKLLDALTVSPKSPIRGRVVTADGEPVEQAIIVASFRDQTLLTDEQGRFSFRSRDRRETFVQALHPHNPLSKAVGIVPGAGETTIVLEREGAVVGIVTDDESNPLAGIPVELKTSFSFGGRGISTVYHRTSSRADGSYRFLGLTPGLKYQAQVRGKQRANYSSTKVELGSLQQLGIPSDIKPLKVDDKLLDEVREIAAIREDSFPEKLRPLSCQSWFNSPPLSADDFKNKPVLLCLGMSPSALNICEIADTLYADRGLCVVGIAPGPMPIPRKLIEESIKRLDITFPFGIDDGTTMRNYSPQSSSDVLLFREDGSFHSKLTSGEFHAIRRYMRYEMR